METLEVNGFYLPDEFAKNISGYETETISRNDTKIRLRLPKITRTVVEELCDYLQKKQKAYLRKIPLKHIINVLDAASRRWMDAGYTYRKQALQTIPVMTGFSQETVAASIDVEMESSYGEDMWRALRSEIGNPLYLDEFQFDPELNGYRRAFGPKLIVSFLSENIPALPHLLFMRAALVKSACLGKVASGEPTFAPMYLKTIEKIDPDLARCMAVLYWRGGERGIEEAAFDQADAVILFGGIKTVNSLIERIPRRIRMLVHGHKLGFGIIGKKMMTAQQIDKLAEAVAYDISMFNQQACLAPHVYYIEEGGEVSGVAFSEKLADRVKEINNRMPRGEIPAGESAAINQLRAKYEIRELKGDDVVVFASPGNTDWTVIYEKDPGMFKPSPLHRFIRIIGVDDILSILPTLKVIGSFLQNAAIAIGDSREKEIREKLAEYGVARITAPGHMPIPSMMWHHDGISPLAALLRWCDIEKEEI